MATFPLNKLMFRQQVAGISLGKAYSHLKAEGLNNLYKGVGPPLVQRSLSMALMFGLYDFFYKQLQDLPGIADSPTACTVLAAVAAGSAEGALAPLERIQTLLQHRHFATHFDDTLDAALKLRPHGLREYYRGLSAVLLRNGPSNALFFLGKEHMSEYFARLDSPVASMIGNFACGALLGACLSTLFFPLNVAKSVMQSQVGGHHSGVVQTVRRVLRERQGVWGLYKGVHINFTRSLLSWGIINMVHELLSKRMRPNTDDLDR